MSELEILELGWKRAEELGLMLGAVNGNKSFYDKNDIHRLLGSGRVVRGAVEPVPEDVAWQYESQWDEYDDHQALLIGIKPIVQESEERKLLRLIVGNSQHNGTLVPSEIVDRIKALLEKP